MNGATSALGEVSGVVAVKEVGIAEWMVMGILRYHLPIYSMNVIRLIGGYSGHTPKTEEGMLHLLVYL